MRAARYLAVPLTFSSFLLAQGPQPLSATIADVSDGAPPVAPVQVSVNLAEATGGAAHGLSGAFAGAADVGGKSVAIVVGKSDERLEEADMIAVDMNADGEMDVTERMPLAVKQQQRMTVGEPVDLGLTLGDKELTARATYVQFPGRPPRVTLMFPRYLVADADLGGSSVRIGVVDADLDGTFGSAGDHWGIQPEGARPINAYGLSAMGEKPWVAGHLCSVKVAGDKLELTAVASETPDPATMAAQRKRVEHLWMERFDDERETFVKQRELDTARPLAKEPIDWKYVTFAEAIEMGQKAGKPVFIDVMAFWCVWCYRMDYYTYPDAEVAKLLNEKFIPVKIIQEQDLAGDYDLVMKEKLGARGIPAMGIFDAEGNVVHTIGGWKKPEDFVAELKKGLN